MSEKDWLAQLNDGALKIDAYALELEVRPMWNCYQTIAHHLLETPMPTGEGHPGIST